MRSLSLLAATAALTALILSAAPTAAAPIAVSGRAQSASEGATAGTAVLPAGGSIGFTTGSAQTAFDVAYSGYVSGAAAAGLTGAARFEFLGATDAGQSWDFRILSLANTSSAPIAASRITQFGFDVSPDVASAEAVGLFDTVDYAGNVPMAGLRDVCFRASKGGSCAGGGNGGLLIGESIGDGYFSLMFDRALDAITLSGFFLRFQSIEGAIGTSGVGIGSAPSLVMTAGTAAPVQAGPAHAAPALADSIEVIGAGLDADAVEVPEPGAVGLLALGMLAIGVHARRRRGAQPRVARP